MPAGPGFPDGCWPGDAEQMLAAAWERGDERSAISGALYAQFGVTVSNRMVSYKATQLGLAPRLNPAIALPPRTEETLLPTDKRLLDHLRKRAADKRPAPTNAEICNLFGLRATSTAVAAVKRLEAGGFIRVVRGHDCRVISAADGSWQTAGVVRLTAPRNRAPKAKAPRAGRILHSVTGGYQHTAHDEARAVEAEVVDVLLPTQPGMGVDMVEALLRKERETRYIPRPPMRLQPGVRYRTCQFPQGEPRSEGFRFCDKPTAPGRPYCEACCHIAYVTPETKVRAA